MSAPNATSSTLQSPVFDTGDNLSQIGVQELAGNGRRHDGYRRIVSVYPALLQRVDHVHDAGYVYSGSKRTVIDAGSAADALFIVDLRFAPGPMGNSSYFCTLSRTVSGNCG